MANIDLSKIYQYVLNYYLKSVIYKDDIDFQRKIIKLTADSEANMAKGNKEPIHLESYFLQVIALTNKVEYSYHQ